MTAVLGAAKTLLRDDIDALARAAAAAARDDRRAGHAADADHRGGAAREPASTAATCASTASASTSRSSSTRGGRGDARSALPESVSVLRPRERRRPRARRPRPDEQVLVNLIDNAVKYSPDGGEVVVTTARPPRRRARLGRGRGNRDPAGRARRGLREVLPRRPAADRATPGGTGLGLYICRELAAAHGRHDRRPLPPRRGSTFYFELPRA